MNKRWVVSCVALLLIGGIWAVFFSPLTNANKTEWNKFSGIVQQGEYNLSFKIGGRLTELFVEEGDWVEQDQLLAQLEQGEWQAKVGQAQAAVDLAQANLDKALKSVGLTEQDGQSKINQAQAAVHMAQAKYEAMLNGARKEELAQLEAKVNLTKESYTQAEENLQRSSLLFEQGAIPQNKLDEAKLLFEQAKAEYTSAKLELEIAQNGARPEEIEAAKQQVEQARAVLQEALNATGKVDLSQADVRVATAQYNQAVANLQEAETYLSYTYLWSPVHGIVTERYVQSGEMLSTGLTVLTIADPQDKWTFFYIPEDDLKQITVNQEVDLYLPALEKKVSGKVVFVNPAPQFATKKASNYLNDRDVRSFAVKVQITEEVEQIYAGMSIEWLGAK